MDLEEKLLDMLCNANWARGLNSMAEGNAEPEGNVDEKFINVCDFLLGEMCWCRALSTTLLDAESGDIVNDAEEKLLMVCRALDGGPTTEATQKWSLRTMSQAMDLIGKARRSTLAYLTKTV